MFDGLSSSLTWSTWIPWLGSGSYSSGTPVQLVREQQAQWAHLPDCDLQSAAPHLNAQSGGALPRRLAPSPSRKKAERSRIQIQNLALAAEAVRRVLGWQLYDCQLWGALTAASGKMIEMQTGEGKTLVCGIAAAMAALEGRRVHVATTNGYLAHRDHQFMEPILEWLGLTSHVLPERPNPTYSRACYRGQIVYGPGYQFGFDFLADQLTRQRYDSHRLGMDTLCSLNGISIEDELIQGSDFDTTIIDEADSVLIDEAMTPLILSGACAASWDPHPYLAAQRGSTRLREGVDFRREGQPPRIVLTPAGLTACQSMRNHLAKARFQRPWTEYVTNALRANLLLRKDVDYVVVDEKVKIVDPLTGRIFEDRTWQSGLHQAVEVKENVPLTQPRQSQARITRQSFVNKYRWISGMSGTLQDTADELQKTYGVLVEVIPPHRPNRRHLLPNRYFVNWAAKVEAIVVDVALRQRRGQPILIGTNSIQKSEWLAEALRSQGLSFVVLNGLQDKSEAEIVAQAGSPGQVTIATNMAGRGTDIALHPDVRGLGGLHVIGTEPNQCRRVDRQLIGRAARQGDPGSAQFFVSADDDLLNQQETGLARRICRTAGKQGEAIGNFATAVWQLQQKAERTQLRIRQQLVGNDVWLNQARQSVFGT